MFSYISYIPFLAHILLICNVGNKKSLCPYDVNHDISLNINLHESTNQNELHLTFSFLSCIHYDINGV